MGIDELPPWARPLIPLLIVAVAMEQRLAVRTPTWAWLAAALVVVPWLLRATCTWVPRWVFVVAVTAGATGLLAHPVNSDMAGFILVYLAGEVGSEWPWRTSLAVAVADAAIVLGLDVTGTLVGVTPWVAGIVLAWCAGAAFQAQRRVNLELRAAQASLAETAATEERQRIAREVHDVIAHSLTVTLLHITAARLALATDPDEARDALLEAERLGRASLGEIRQTVGLLKAGASGTDFGPMPGSDDIPGLVGQFSSAGLPVEVHIDGELSDIPASMGLGVYRIVQESLSNVAKHAQGAPALLAICVTPDSVSVRVENKAERRPVGVGLGLTGMKERATVLGGSLTAGPTDEGWAVEVTLPRVAA